MSIHSVVHGRLNRRGAVTVWLLVGLVVIIGIVAIGMDGGRMLEKRRHAQATADAAALAGALSLFQIDIGQNGNAYGKKQNAAQSAALALAAANGFNNDGVTSTVTVNAPPSSGVFAGQTDFVEVIVQYNLSKSFGAIFTSGNLPVSARAVAVGRPLQLGILTLSQSGSNTFLQNGKGTLNVANGYVFVNSVDPAAFAVSNSGSVSAQEFDITGNYTNSGGSIQGPIHTGVRRTPDPFLSLTSPNSGSVQSNAPLTITNSKKTTLQPGVYIGGINIGGSANVVLSPGIYVLQGGGIQVSGQADLTGNGVLIYNTSGTSAAGPINIDTDGDVNLSASTSGAYQGVIIFQDRGIAQPLTITGNGSTTIGGTVYAVNAAVKLTGNGDDDNPDTLGGGYICSSMQVVGSGSINIDPGKSPLLISEIALTE